MPLKPFNNNPHASLLLQTQCAHGFHKHFHKYIYEEYLLRVRLRSWSF